MRSQCLECNWIWAPEQEPPPEWLRTKIRAQSKAYKGLEQMQSQATAKTKDVLREAQELAKQSAAAKKKEDAVVKKRQKEGDKTRAKSAKENAKAASKYVKEQEKALAAMNRILAKAQGGQAPAAKVSRARMRRCV